MSLPAFCRLYCEIYANEFTEYLHFIFMRFSFDYIVAAATLTFALLLFKRKICFSGKQLFHAYLRQMAFSVLEFFNYFHRYTLWLWRATVCCCMCVCV